MYLKFTLYIIIAAAVLTSCKDDQVTEPIPIVDYLKVTMQPTFGTNELLLDQTFTTAEGYLVQFTDLKCYFTSMKNGSNELCKAALYDYRETGTLLFSKPGKPADYASLNGFVGVDQLYNHEDPSAFANENPLNIAIANDMHWDWNPGYIFMKVEAKVDTTADAIENFDHFVIFHIGTDAFIQPISLPSITWTASGTGLYTLPLKLDMQKFLQNGPQTIDLKTEYSSHSSAGQEALSLKVIQNFKDAISFY